ncbi:MAG: hypothetical protein ACK6AY_01405, partial [Akkermansiaceae bacterium]
MKPFLFIILSSSIALAAPENLDETIVKASTSPTLTQATLEQYRLDLAKIPGGTENIDEERFLTGRTSTFDYTFALSHCVVAQS